MSKRLLAFALAPALVAAAGWALAQEPAPPTPDARPPVETGPVQPPAVPVDAAPVQPPAVGDRPQVRGHQPGQKPAPGVPPRGAGAPGRYAVALSGERGLLVDTATGKTWELVRGAGDRAVWAPVRRLESGRDFDKWRDRQKALGADRKALEREEARAVQREERDKVAKEQEVARAAVLAEQRRLLALKAQQDKVRAEQEIRLKELQARERQLRRLQEQLDAARLKQGK
jgi:hypothetical protein